MATSIIGIDVSKQKFDATLLYRNKEKHRVFPNNVLGFEQLIKWMLYQGVQDVHICLEATGIYGEGLALYLHEAGYKISVVNPARIKAYGRSELSRNKTDKADSRLIARFCKTQSPSLWSPPSPALRRLRKLYQCLQNLKAD